MYISLANQPIRKKAMRLLLVEDDEKIASFIAKGFEQSGFAVDHAADG